MVRRAPGALTAAIGANAFARHADVWNLEYVRNRRRVESTDATRSPNFCLHRSDRPVLRRAQFDSRVVRRTIARDHQLNIALQEQFDRPARLLGEQSADGAPFVVAELRSESAAHELAFDVDFTLIDTHRPAELVTVTRDVLGRRPDIQLAVAHFGHLAVRFEAAMGDDRNAILAFDHLAGFGEGVVHVALLALVQLVLYGIEKLWIVVHDLVRQRFVLHLDSR